MRRIIITEEQAAKILAEKQIPKEMTGISGRVAVVLTQSWCPQWSAMNAYLDRMQKDSKPETEDLTVFSLCYDNLPFKGEFMSFKESVFSNDLIPFVLYYRDGKLINSSNYVSLSSFMELF